MSTCKFKFNFDEEVQDTVTKLKGVVIAVDFWRNGCIRYCVQAPINKDGEIPDGRWVDEGQLILTKKSRGVFGKPPTGGPRPSTDLGMGRK